jgi:hypothetical protein
MTDKMVLYWLFRLFCATILVVPLAIALEPLVILISLITNSQKTQDFITKSTLWAFFIIANPELTIDIF